MRDVALLSRVTCRRVAAHYTRCGTLRQRAVSQRGSHTRPERRCVRAPSPTAGLMRALDSGRDPSESEVRQVMEMVDDNKVRCAHVGVTTPAGARCSLLLCVRVRVLVCSSLCVPACASVCPCVHVCCLGASTRHRPRGVCLCPLCPHRCALIAHVACALALTLAALHCCPALHCVCVGGGRVSEQDGIISWDEFKGAMTQWLGKSRKREIDDTPGSPSVRTHTTHHSRVATCMVTSVHTPHTTRHARACRMLHCAGRP